MSANLIIRTTVALALALIIFLLAGQPIPTNDGPVHTGFADRLAHLSDPDRELQREVYETDVQLRPNLVGYLIAWPLMWILPALAVESILQFICLFGPALAAWIALRTISQDNAWLSIFVIPMAINQTFFLGLYNFCISIAFIFLTIACYWRLVWAPALWRSILLGLMLNLTMLSHAAGFISVAFSVIAMSGARMI